jgi:hypothetical protein
MRDPRVPLKNPVVAGILAFLIPGAGHWYQGRRFKATIFSVCILTMFIWGMVLGNWQPVYSQLVQRNGTESAQLTETVPPMKFSFGYGAQVLVGLPALPSLIQEMRFRNDQTPVRSLSSDLSSEFVGVVKERGGNATFVTGTASLSPVNPEGSRTVTGTLNGVDREGTEINYELGGLIQLGRPVFGSPRREIRCDVIARNGIEIRGELLGSVERPMINWFQAPRDTHELDRLHGELSRRFDIASMFTWIAGLLNLLAIWDAADGPAYAYGDEKREDDPDDKEPT